MSDEDRWKDYPGVKECKQVFGTGDGANEYFSGSIRGPVIPGTVYLRQLPEDAVSQLGMIDSAPDDMTNVEQALHDIGKDGVLHGHTYGGSNVDYDTGFIAASFQNAPAAGSPIWIFWKRRLHKHHDALVQVKRPDGELEWIDLDDLNRALGSR